MQSDPLQSHVLPSTEPYVRFCMYQILNLLQVPVLLAMHASCGLPSGLCLAQLPLPCLSWPFFSGRTSKLSSSCSRFAWPPHSCTPAIRSSHRRSSSSASALFGSRIDKQELDIQATSKMVAQRPLTMLIPILPLLLYASLGLFWVWSTIYLYTSCKAFELLAWRNACLAKA